MKPEAEAILELKLRHLAKLQEMEIRQEQDELSARAALIREQLANPESLKNLIIGELKEDAKNLGMSAVLLLWSVKVRFRCVNRT